MTAVIVEMDEVAKAAAAAGDTQLQGRALTALADAVLYQRADALGAQRLITEARELFGEIVNALREAAMTLNLGRAAVAQGDLERGEKLLRDSERALKGLSGRGQLCEAQRALAQVLVRLGRLEEAERFALESRETVGPEDRVSGSTTKVALAEVRAAQG